jgi:hypothetical protein
VPGETQPGWKFLALASDLRDLEESRKSFFVSTSPCFPLATIIEMFRDRARLMNLSSESVPGYADRDWR